ncbi:hypothetical protein P886_2088 [Alteromonadaceae bacterium 2753L.S.0a.02]|nr:hypothetical protein P886_2088 [Alteromonadaceae bacterium 2753L.S.0a.02]
MLSNCEIAHPTHDNTVDIPERTECLNLIQHSDISSTAKTVISGLRNDDVVIVQNVAAELADTILAEVADQLGLKSQLEVQSGFAAIKGHRDNIGTYFMTVNKTADYEFIGPHSEGTQFTDMHLASMYCYENDTDGGESVLLHVDQNSAAIADFKEVVWKIRLINRELSPAEKALAKMKWQINIPEDILSDNDQVLRQRESYEEGIELYEVLAKTPMSYSKILARQVKVFWDNISSADRSSVTQYRKFLETEGLLKLPPGGATTQQLDHSDHRRIWDSDLSYEAIFDGKLIRKLRPGELVFINNLTWTHAIANWTPKSGTRKIAVAFA